MDGSARADRTPIHCHVTHRESPRPCHASPPPIASAVLTSPRLLQNAGAVEENQLLSGAESQNAEVRVAFEEQAAAAADQQGAASEDQETAAQGSIDEISLDDVDGSEENRNKR